MFDYIFKFYDAKLSKFSINNLNDVKKFCKCETKWDNDNPGKFIH